MRKINLAMLACTGILLFFQIACNKTPVIRQVSGGPGSPSCDTCTSAIDKEVIINVTTENWKEGYNGQYYCDLGHLMVGNGIKIDSVRVLIMYAGLGRDAIKLSSNNVVDYNGGTLLWYGFYTLRLTLAVGNPVPALIPIRIELESI
jgi:hypothetical protein